VTSLLTNNAALSALTTLKGIGLQVDVTTKRVSTGQRVSDAADNAAYWAIATAVRTDNAALGAVKDSLGLGASAVDTAYNGLNSVLSDLQALRAKLQTALQPGVDRAKVQTEIQAIQTRMKATADSSTSSGQNWLSVDSASTNLAYRPTQNVVAGFTRDITGTVSFSRIGVDVAGIKLYDASTASVSTPATAARLTGPVSMGGAPGFVSGTADFSGTNEAAIRLYSSGGTDTLILNRETLAAAVKNLAKVTPDELVEALNNQIAASPALRSDVTAARDASGRLRFETTASGAGAYLVAITGTSTLGKSWLDIGFGGSAGIAAYPPVVAAAQPYANLNLSGANTKTITFNDGTTTTTVTLNAASTPAPANPASVTFAEIHAMLNANLALQGSGIGFGTSSSGSGVNYLVLNGAGSGPAATVTVGGADAPAFGFVVGQSGTGSTGVNGSQTPTARGSDAATTLGRGILDTVGTHGFAVSTIDIAGLSGTAGDATLADVITQVEAVIARVTDAGTKLGANKTQIDGQRSFVETLMKANDRTVGILVDADVEEESTRLKALQTQQQLSVQGLGIANGASAGILALFR
jgi:flagellin